jgi:hypothetical protein
MTEPDGNGTAIAPVGRNKTGQFIKGHRKSGGGRKPGSRNKAKRDLPAIGLPDYKLSVSPGDLLLARLRQFHGNP